MRPSGPVMCTHLISFDEIAPGATIRVTTFDGKQYLSVRDLIMCVCEKNQNDAGEVWRNLSPYKSNLDHNLQKHKFRGRGQSKQPVITISGAMKLIMVLPGARAKQMRSTAADILSRYLTGDETLIEDIKNNKIIGPIAACKKMAVQAIKGQIEPMPTSGWLYGTESNAFPGNIKIGCSMDLDARMRSANTFCSPAPHVVVAAVPTFDPRRDEKRVHAFFASGHVSGEFFQTSKEAVQAYFDAHVMPVYQAELKQAITKLY